MMTFALCPDDGPPRIWRYFDESEVVSMPHRGMITYLEESTNILCIIREPFEKLSEIDKHMVLRTHAPFTVLNGVSYREVFK